MLMKFFENPSQLLFLGGVALMTWVLMRRIFKHRNRSKKRIDPIKEVTKRERPLQGIDAPLEAARWEVRLHDIGRDLTAQIDSKLSALQALTKLAHEAAERLEIAVHHSIDQEMSRYGLSTLDGIERRLQEVTFEVGAAVKIAPVEPKAKAIDPIESLRRVVRQMLMQGLTAEEISAQTEMPLGEVEFLASTLKTETLKREQTRAA